MTCLPKGQRCNRQWEAEGSEQGEFLLVIVSMLQFSKGVVVEQVVFSDKVYLSILN